MSSASFVAMLPVLATALVSLTVDVHPVVIAIGIVAVTAFLLKQ